MTTPKKQTKKQELPAFSSLVDDRCEPFESDKQVDFIMRTEILKYTVEEASKQVGISMSYGYKIIKDWRKKPKFRAKIFKKLKQYPEDYQSGCKVLLPVVFKAEVGGVQAMLDDPTLAVRHPGLLKQIKQGAGITFSEDSQPVTQTVNIQLIQKHILNSIQDSLSDDAEPVEAIDIEVSDPVEDK